MKKVLATLFGAAMLLMATPAQAHHPIVSGSAVCNVQTGLFDVKWTITNSESVESEGDRDMTITSSDRASVPVGTVIQEVASQDFFESLPPGGTATLNMAGKWTYTVMTSAGPQERNVGPIPGTATVSLEGECEEPAPTPTPEPTPPASPTPTETPAVAEPGASPVAAPVESSPTPVPVADEQEPKDEVKASGAERAEDSAVAAAGEELPRTGGAGLVYMAALAVAMLVTALLAHVAASRRRRASQ